MRMSIRMSHCGIGPKGWMAKALKPPSRKVAAGVDLIALSRLTMCSGCVRLFWVMNGVGFGEPFAACVEDDLKVDHVLSPVPVSTMLCNAAVFQGVCPEWCAATPKTCLLFAGCHPRCAHNQPAKTCTYLFGDRHEHMCREIVVSPHRRFRMEPDCRNKVGPMR